MRKKPTRAEALVWDELRYWRYAGAKFQQQIVLRGYIADFYCPKAKLVVEIDGPIHVAAKDRIRDFHLSKAGIKVIRFTNSQVFRNLQQVLIDIRNAYRSRRKTSKLLMPKKFNKKPKRARLKFSTIQQASSSSYIEKLKIKSSDCCVCGYVQIYHPPTDSVRYIRLPLFGSVMEPNDRGGCPEQAFAGYEAAENFCRIEAKYGRPSIPYHCEKCKQIHIGRKQLTQLAVVR